MLFDLFSFIWSFLGFFLNWGYPFSSWLYSSYEIFVNVLLCLVIKTIICFHDLRSFDLSLRSSLSPAIQRIFSNSFWLFVHYLINQRIMNLFFRINLIYINLNLPIISKRETNLARCPGIKCNLLSNSCLSRGISIANLHTSVL